MENTKLEAAIAGSKGFAKGGFALITKDGEAISCLVSGSTDKEKFMVEQDTAVLSPTQAIKDNMAKKGLLEVLVPAQSIDKEIMGMDMSR